MSSHPNEQGQPREAAPPAGARGHFDAAIAALAKVYAPIVGQWTRARQVTFLNAIADGATVADAALAVGLTARSAYQFRKRVEGDLFSVGWTAASLLARDALHDTLYQRAVQGQSWTVERDDGERVISTTRHRHDNRLAMAMLTRLDRLTDETITPELSRIRLIAGDFDGFLARLVGGADTTDMIEFLSDSQKTLNRMAKVDLMADQPVLQNHDDGAGGDLAA